MAKKNNDKNENKQEIPTEQPTEEVNGCVEDAPQSADDIDIIALAQAKLDEYKATLQRVQADFDNFRKRNAESVKLARIDGGNDMIIAMLPIKDSVDIAVNMTEDEATKKGVVLIQKSFVALFERYGVKEIPALGEEFNPELHNAVMQVEDEENAGKVVEVIQKGYLREGRVIRYSMVKVAK